MQTEKLKGAAVFVFDRAKAFFSYIGSRLSAFRRPLSIAALSLLLLLCVPAFAAANEVFIFTRSMGAVSSVPQYSQENLDIFREEDTDLTLSDSDTWDIQDANAEIIAFMESNQEPINTEYDGIINILLIGCDSNDYSGHLRSDSMMILSVDTERGKVKLISLLRDMRVMVNGGYDKLNAAFAYDSSGQLLLDTIEQNFLLDIDDFVCINYRAFKDAVDLLGGVRVTVEEGDIKAINKCISDPAHHITEAGEQLLDGPQTLGFCQMRKVGTDFGRTERQRTVMTELLKMAQNMSLVEMKQLIEDVAPNVLTNMTEGELFYLAFVAASMDSMTVEQMHIPIDNSWRDLVVDNRWFLSFNHKDNVDALHQMIYGDYEAALAKAALISDSDAASDAHHHAQSFE